MDLTAKIEEKDCSRCSGRGEIDHFSHVLRGICFRCWGLGTDPKTVEELEVWLAKARLMYSVRRNEVRAGRGTPTIERELTLIEKMGKQNKTKAERLRQAYKALHAKAVNEY